MTDGGDNDEPSDTDPVGDRPDVISDAHQRHDPLAGKKPRVGWTVWEKMALGIVIAMVVAGLAMIALLVLFYIGMNQWGSNK